MPRTPFYCLDKTSKFDSYGPSDVLFDDPTEALVRKYGPNGVGSDRDAISSLYWHVPDPQSHLTSIASHATENLLAVSSGSKEANLFIYEVDPSPNSKSITHHQTISLPDIRSLAWVNPGDALGSYGNVVATGHSNGYVHLVLLPDKSAVNERAEILKRFNHMRHLPTSSGHNISTRIRQLGLTNSSVWACCAPSSLITLFSSHLFLWDPSRSDIPVMKVPVKSGECFHASDLRNGVVALGGSKGVSIMDIRVRNPIGLSPPKNNDGPVHHVKWSAIESNTIASVHGSSTLKIWDIRAGAPMLILNNHLDSINDIQWDLERPNVLHSASSDGTIRLWDTQQIPQPEPSSSISHNPDFNWLPKTWKDYRQHLSRYSDSTVTSYYDTLENMSLRSTPDSVFSSNKQFLGLSSLTTSNGNKLISIDNEGYLGIHSQPHQHRKQSRDSTISNSSMASLTADEYETSNSSLEDISFSSPLNIQEMFSKDAASKYSYNPLETASY